MQKFVAAGVVCSLIMVMDITAGVLGIEADMAQNKVEHFRERLVECRGPSQTAFDFGLAAAVLLALAHISANLLGGCTCLCSINKLRRASADKQFAMAALIFSWIIWAVGSSMLMLGTMENSRKSCGNGMGNHRFLSIGGIVCFLHAVFIAAYCVPAIANDAQKTQQPQQGGHA
ncbi:protein DESIGUAL 2-like [Diospyros lotus]|uniref:protein DESIGUAL 2-like n=1 Tax=Diospyros lotus TaxID=55363 RepID=UPI002254E608|nr:protein DESIGUAL 2-like [Diospyros lotus]